MNVRDLLRLLSIQGIGPARFASLLDAFGDPARVFTASVNDLLRVKGISKPLAEEIVSSRESSERFADEQLAKTNRANARILTLRDNEYPPLLKEIYDPPPLLFIQGRLQTGDSRSVSLVGTRKPNEYGKAVARKLGEDFGRLKITTVSGMARGIDTEVHKATLQAGGRTIALLGSGIDVPYPPENKNLMEKITQNGAVLSEFPMGTTPDPGNFPRRNRLISGLSPATIVIQSRETGGGMITATTALDQGREVYAVPGYILDEFNAGPHQLIRDSRAKLFTSAADLIRDLPHQFGDVVPSEAIPEESVEISLFEANILDLLSFNPLHIDEISDRAGSTSVETLVTLLSLEFKGLVRQLPGKHFVKQK